MVMRKTPATRPDGPQSCVTFDSGQSVCVVCCAVLECVVLACKCKEAVQARRTMIVFVFVPEAFLCPSVARSLPPMSRSATCLEFDVLELSELSLANASGSTKRFVRAGSRVERGARQMLQVAWTMAQRISCIDPASVYLVGCGVQRACKEAART